ncbi:MAG: ferrochelatase [Alphaproteobacteria bacterium]|nr:ferrochelatase [Alphaproteobacteria bacterium]
MKTAIVLFNLGGPDSPEAVAPFLRNLFSDPAIIALPGFLRRPLARIIAARRGSTARGIYAQLGGKSPILTETCRQKAALEAAMRERGIDAQCVIGMRCWKPFIRDAFDEIERLAPDTVLLLPLYPQYSTTTTGSSLKEWERLSSAQNSAKAIPITSYPELGGFIDALADLLQQSLTRRRQDVDYRILLSAHGLPKRIVEKGDPYCRQVERTARALVERLGIVEDWRVTYQSRVGPLAWVGPATDDEIRRAGSEGKGVIVVPISFVSEHAETLVELDIDYAKLARESGVPDYLRVPSVGTHPAFIAGLADLAAAALGGARGVVKSFPAQERN